VQPILIASQSVPVVAIAPILVIYLGFGLAPKVLIVALVCFFPITVNTLDGLERVDPEYRRMLRTLDATRWQVFRRVELPWSLPGLFAGARIAASYSAVAAVFAEYAGGQSGLVDSMRDGFDTPLVGAAIVVLALMSLALYGAVTVAERLTLPWARGR
jgi:ABC-type nitrate/sulfonate/bicarbonate transport system permease component